MTREKIIQLAKECGAYVYKAGDSVFDSPAQLEAFYKLAQAEAFEAAAKLCDEQQLEPECPERASYCAAAIREMAKEMK